MSVLKRMLVLLVASSAMGQTYLSPCDIDFSADGKTAYVTAATGRQVLYFDQASEKITHRIPFPAQLSGAALGREEGELFVAGGGYDGRIWVVRDGAIAAEFEAGHTPTSPVLSPDGQTLYVCNRFDNDVSFIDVNSGQELARVPVLREPVAADISQDGKTLFVANLLPDGRADVDYVASKISVIDVATKTVKTIKLVNGSEGVRGLQVSPDGKYVYATHMMARFLVPTTQLERGWISTDALSVIRVADQKLLYTVLLDDVDMGFPNPWAIGFSEDGNSLLVSSAGNHEISLIDLPKLTEKISTVATGDRGAAHLDAHNDLSFLTGLRKRIKLAGNGPRSLAVLGSKVYAANYFSDSIDIVDISNPSAVSSKSVELNPGVEITQERLGEIYFNDADLCFQKWLSCATCHPDTRTDGLNWDLLNDGMGNPKNVRSMLLAHQTPRAMTLAVRADAETAVRAGIKFIQFAVRPEEDAVAIDTYLKALTPEPSPYLVKAADGTLEMSPSAKRGKKLFESMSCVKCHPAPLYTDLNTYDVGTTTGQDIGRPVDVPTLVEIWRTAPYLHDGRAATMRDVLRNDGHAGILKETADLSEEELVDLEMFLLSL